MSDLNRIASLDDGDFAGKRVLLRVDINSPIDRDNGGIVNDNRIRKSLPTIRDLRDAGARLVRGRQDVGNRCPAHQTPWNGYSRRS